MTQTIEVEVGPEGVLHVVEQGVTLPQGRAYLTWEIADTPYDVPAEAAEGLLMSEAALSDWLRPEEEEAWAHLQPGK